MKVKLPSRQTPAETGNYLCIWCDMEFPYVAGKLSCPSCGNSNRTDLVPIYIEDNPKEDQLYSAVDWHGG